MGDEEREGATRSQNILLQGPADARTMAAAMRAGVERSRESLGIASPGCLIIAPTVEQSLVAADLARTTLADSGARVVPVSHVGRARRVLAAGDVAVVTGTADDLLSLRRESALNIEQLRAVVIVGLDEVLADGGATALEALLGDTPSDAMRVATVDVENDQVSAFLDAQLRRARRIAPSAPTETPLAVSPSYLLTSPAGRPEALRAVLDAVDPPSLVVVANSDASESEARAALTRLGLPADGLLIQVVRQPTSQHVSLVVLWDAPATADALVASLATRPVDAVALLAPEDLPAFRRMTHGSAAVWAPASRKHGTVSRVQRLRAALVDSIQRGGGATASELALLTPLLDAFDAVEIASAALRLYEGALKDLASTKAAAAAAQAAARVTASDARAPRGLSVMQGGATGKQRVFLAIGKRDDVRVGDIVGAVANEAGIAGERIGAVEMFESHTTVELAAEDAARAVEALASATLRGRKLNARLDERTERPDRSMERRPARTFGPPRSGPRPERSDRAERPPMRGGKPARGDAPTGFRDGGSRSGPAGGKFGGATEARREFGDRPASERTETTTEWSQRGERMKHAKRPPRESPERNDEV